MSLPVSPIRQDIINKINQNLANNSTITPEEHREIELLLVDAVFGGQLGDIKEITCNQQYINDNFETGTGNSIEGKGKLTGERYGWAICNGKNGTVDKGGNVSVGYSSSKSFNLSPSGVNDGSPGKRTHTLSDTEIPPHNHVFPGDDQLSFANGQGGWTNRIVANFNYDAASTNNTGGKIYRTSDTGGLSNTTQAHNNMQPYIVTLFIQRIAV